MTSKIAVVHLYARIGDSEVLNEIATMDVNASTEPITDDSRRPGDAAEATVRVAFDLANALRKAADEIDAQQIPADHEHKPVQHRDGKPPWCKGCGLTAEGRVPVSRIGRG